MQKQFKPSPYSLIVISYSLIIAVVAVLLLLTGCSPADGTDTAQAAQAATATPSPTPTSPPPPPQVAFTPVPPGTISPVVIQRFPRRGEELAPDGVIELVFDRAMNPQAAADAFTLQSAAEQPQPISGAISWADAGRTMRFTPDQALEQAAVFDAILTQAAVAEDGAPLAEPFTFRFSTPGYLEVTQVIPADGTADMQTNATFTVMFNRPVVPLTSLEEAENFPQPLRFDPPIEGEGEWLNTSIYLFTPKTDLPGGTTYKATVSAGLQDVTQKTYLPDDFSWSFTTQPPEVVFTNPGDGQTLVPVESPLVVQFSQPIDPQSAQANFTVEETGLLGSSISGDLAVIDNTLTFTPTQQLDFDTTYQVTIDTGVTNVSGGSGMVAPYSFRFTSVPLPRITETRPVNGDNAASPYTNFVIYFNTNINPATVMEHVEMVPPLPITPTLVYTSYSPYNHSFSFNFGAKPSTDYKVLITPGIEDPYGNKTTDNLTVNFRTQPVQPNYRLRTPDFVGTYDADLPAKIVVGTMNVDTIDMNLYQLDESEILRPQWEWYDYQPAGNAALVRQWTEKLQITPNEQSFHPVDLVDGGGSVPPGLYLLETSSPQIEYNDRYSQRHLLVVTNINLTLKAGQRDTLVWATDLSSGDPLPGLEINFYDDDSRQLGTATTNAEGIANLDLSERPNRSTILAAVFSSPPLGGTEGGPFSAVSENWAQGISPYEFGIDLAYQLPDFTTHIYTDRPIYRPGQTVNFKGSIRAEDDINFSLPDVGQVFVQILDANYETIYEEELELTPSATFNGKIELAEGASLGNYVIAVQFAGQYIEQYFQVAAYRPPEFEVTVEPEADELLRGDDVNATINTSYFFGGPLAGANVDWNVLAESYRFSVPQLGNYSFDDADDPYTCFDCWWWYQPPAPMPIMSGSGISNASGELEITLDGQELNDLLDKGSYRLIIEATASGPDNQFISGRAPVVLHKGDYYIGLSPQENVADAGQETAIDLVAVDWAGERLPNKEIQVQVVRYEWVNTYVQEGNGGYWTSETKKEETDRFTVTTDALGEAEARFTPPKGGSYQVIVQDVDTLTQSPDAQSPNLQISPIRSSIFIWVAGEDDVSWRRENHDRLTLISDKAEYLPGETAEILIPSPFEGDHYALVTVERGRIKQQEVIEITGSSQIYKLPITEDHAPNIYVSVVLVQGRTPHSPPVNGGG